MKNEDIAVVGMACMFPGADTLSQFWQNIVGKKDCISEAPPDWQPELFHDPTATDPDRSYTNRGGFLGDLSRFDATKYGVPPRSIEGAEPDHFIALRCAYEALADAGVPELALNREKTGVIVGRGLFINRGWASLFQRTFGVDQLIGVLRRLEPQRSEGDLENIKQELKNGLPPTAAESAPGLVHSALVGRIANRLDLRGPAFTIDAACSSALMAVDMGMRELRTGACDAMLVGASQVSTPAPVHVIFCYLNAMSRAGKIAPFSAEASGTLLGQGCGMVVLKRLSDAERDGNRIYSVLKSIGVSSDGRGAALLAPLSEGQQLAINRAYEQTDIAALSLGLIEAHGTGIPLGDRTEMQSLDACFPRVEGDDRQIALGAVKSMIGHLIPASGVASLIKTSLAVHHRVLPPTLHVGQPNPDLQIENTRFFLCSEPKPWLHADRATPRRAGVNAFGFGGINAHAILEEHVPANEADLPRLEQNWPEELVVLSAIDRHSLTTRVKWLSDWVERAEGATLLDIAAACGKQTGNSRLAIVARSREDLIKKLKHIEKLLQDKSRDRIQDRHGIFWYSRPLAKPGSANEEGANTGRIAFMFPGEGAQYANMMHELCRHFPEVRRQFDLTAEALKKRTNHKPLGRTLFPQPGEEKQSAAELLKLEVAVAAVTAAGRGILELLHGFNVTADAIVGHSSGEFGSLLAAGVYRPKSEEDAIEAVIAGVESAGQLETSGLVPNGTLLAVGGADPQAVERVLKDAGGRLSLAMDNCPHQVIIAGDEEDIDAAVNALQGKGGLCERLSWDRAYHTEAFAPACKFIDKFYDRFTLQAPEVDLWSCASAARYSEDPATIQELAVRQWRSAVRFRETVEAMYGEGIRIFVEVGPRGMLSSFVADTLGERPHAAVPMDVQRKGDVEQLCKAIGMLVAHGVPVDMSPLFERRRPKTIDLNGGPPAPVPRDPILKLELPVFTLGDQAVADYRKGSVTRPTTSPTLAPEVSTSRVATPPVSTHPVSAPPAAASHSEMRPGSATVNRGNGRVSTVPEVIAPASSVADSSERAQKARALVDFQRSMQMFLEVQQNVMAARRASAPTVVPMAALAASQPQTKRWMFLDRVVEHEPGRQLVGECELDINEHRYLLDHTFFGRGLSVNDPTLHSLPIMPLAMTLEMMAEAATELRPELKVMAVSQIVTSGWLTFETPRRRVRIAATLVDQTRTRVEVIATDGAEKDARVAEATVEHSQQMPDLGPPKLPRAEGPPPEWKPEDLYGRILYHGPAFRGIEVINKCGPSGMEARIRLPDPRLLFSNRDGRDLVLPATLIDTASQIPGVANFGRSHADGLVTLAFPNTTERVEFAAPITQPQPLFANIRYEVRGRQLHSDVEFTAADGRVMLRYMGRVEEIVHFPYKAYAYAFNPRKELCSREITELFSDVDGIEQCTLTEVDRVGGKTLVNHLWAKVLARMVLSRSERDQWQSKRQVPVRAAEWLLGRIACKDAVRIHYTMDVGLADVTIGSEPAGQPVVVSPEGSAPRVSIAHTGFYAVAATTDAPRRIGVDVEPLGKIDSGVVNDTFDLAERKIIEAEPDGFLAAWTAKEAIGKALGRGFAGRPRDIRIVSASSEQGRITFAAVLEGAMAKAFPDYAGDDAKIQLHAYCRAHREHMFSLCLLQEETS